MIFWSRRSRQVFIHKTLFRHYEFLQIYVQINFDIIAINSWVNDAGTSSRLDLVAHRHMPLLAQLIGAAMFISADPVIPVTGPSELALPGAHGERNTKHTCIAVTSKLLAI